MVRQKGCFSRPQPKAKNSPKPETTDHSCSLDLEPRTDHTHGTQTSGKVNIHLTSLAHTQPCSAKPPWRQESSQSGLMGLGLATGPAGQGVNSRSYCTGKLQVGLKRPCP